MLLPDFNAVLEKRIETMRTVLVNKAREYASDADRLHNFKMGAVYQGCTPAQALLGYATKHLVSIADMVKADANGNPPSPVMVDEKIGDAINYLVLLEAVFVEKLNTAVACYSKPKEPDAPVQSRPARKPAARS